MVLPISDAAWLMVESPETPQHAGALMVFEYPDETDERWVLRLYDRFRNATDLAWPFNQKLKHPYGRFKRYSWVHDSDVDLDYHFRLSALPAQSGDEALMDHISRLHSVALDRTRPLWEIHLIDNIGPAEGSNRPRFAMHAKFHHSLFDGVGSMRILQRMFTDDSTLRDMPPPWQVSAKAQKTKQRDRADGVEKRQRSHAKSRLAAGAVATTARTLSTQLKNRRNGYSFEALPFVAPRSSLNIRVSGARRTVAGSWSLDRMLSAAKNLDVSLNDVVVAMSAHAVRAYLVERDALPAQPMTAMIPVSIRAENDDANGNALSFVIADLGTNLTEPGARIQRISTSISDSKKRVMSMARVEQISYGLAIASPYLIAQLIGLGGYGPPPTNLVISNVPGPESTRFLDGAPLRSVYPVSLLAQGQGLNITMASYDSQMQFVLTACRKSLPNVESMLGFMEDGLAALEASA